MFLAGSGRAIFFETPKNQGTAIKEGAQRMSLPVHRPLPFGFAVLKRPPMCATVLANDRFWQDRGLVGVGFWRFKKYPSPLLYCSGLTLTRERVCCSRPLASLFIRDGPYQVFEQLTCLGHVGPVFLKASHILSVSRLKRSAFTVCAHGIKIHQ